MRAALVVARHDLRLTLSSRAAVLWMFVFPVLFAAFFGLVSGGTDEEGIAVARLAVTDRDGGPLARRFLEALEGEGLELVLVGPDEGGPGEERRLEIPRDFDERVLRGEPVSVVLRAGRSLDEAAFAIEARIISAIARTLGALVEAKLSAGDSEADLSALAPAERRDDLVTVKATVAGRVRSAPSGFAQSVPGNTVMFVLLVAMTWGAAGIADERKSGTLRRLATAPITAGEIVAGKILGRFAVAAVQVVVLFVTGVVAVVTLDLPLGGDPVAIGIVVLAWAAAVAPMGVLVGAVVREPNRAANAGVLITLTLAALGGCWWPLEVVGGWMQRIGRALPTGWAMTALERLIAFGGDLTDVAPWIGVMLGFAAAATLAARRVLRVT